MLVFLIKTYLTEIERSKKYIKLKLICVRDLIPLALVEIIVLQGWEFAHLISERIARFLSKNERMSDSLKKMSDSLICSFSLSDLSESLT